MGTREESVIKSCPIAERMRKRNDRLIQSQDSDRGILMHAGSRILVLGPVAVHAVNGAITYPTQMVARLLACLAARIDRRVSTATMATMLWGEDRHPSGSNVLQVHVSVARKLVAPADIIFEANGYRLVAEPNILDSWWLEHHSHQAALALGASDFPEAARRAVDGCALWRGKPFDGLDEPEINAQAAALAERHVQCRETLLEAQLGLASEAADFNDLIVASQQLMMEHPLRESAARIHIRALVAASRQGEAMAAYTSLAERLRRSLGAAPSADTQRLAAQLSGPHT